MPITGELSAHAQEAFSLSVRHIIDRIDIDLPLKTSLHAASPLSQTHWQMLKDVVLKAMLSGSSSPKLCVKVGASTFRRKKN